MRYMLLIYGDPAAGERTAPPAGVIPDWLAATRALREAGVLEAGDGLQPAADATTVRLRDGDRLVTDGPFAESREELLGFYLVELPDLDMALGWAERLPHAGWGATEIRAVAGAPAPQLIITRG